LFVFVENWIGDSKNSLTLAIAKECFNIKLITNEHNCFFHIYEGNYSDLLVQLSDTFITLGWNSKNKKVLRGGSLYPFKLEMNKIEIDVLFVAGGLLYKKPIFSSFYSNCGDSAIKSIEFNKTFFSYLDKSTLKKINYLSYPIKKISTLGIIKKEMFYDTKGLLQVKGSARKLMPKSRLVIIDYVSTSFIESIASDIPTIVFFDPNIKRLNKESINFFNSLIRSEIFQTNPKNAALHLKKIINNPEKWWNSMQVQKAKKDFLVENLNLDKLTNIILEINNNS
jgi:putative transferase (TIGR04331 family)